LKGIVGHRGEFRGEVCEWDGMNERNEMNGRRLRAKVGEERGAADVSSILHIREMVRSSLKLRIVT
jgi:hypothetical protein